MGGDVRDVVVVGAGPAGATAAAALAKEGRSVSLVDRATFPRTVNCAGWLNARASAVLDELGVKIKSLRKCAFRDVTFHRADFTQSAKPTFQDAPGYLIDRAEFDNALVDNAVAHGAEFIPGQAVTDARLKESSVLVRLTDGRALEGRLLLLATGREAELLERVGLIAPRGESSFWSAQVGAPLPGGKAPQAARLDAVLGLDNGRSFGLCCVSADRISIGVNWAGELKDAIPALIHLCRELAEHKVASIDLSQQAHQAELVRSPAGVALDMESHVGKHTLVIGDAGGFISAVSNEGIYPAMWSAQIAAEVADKALYSVHSQDELISFDSLWRMRMADYLRSPHTDIQFLLPLVFTNQPMTDRMGAAFFMGENI